MRRRLCAPCGIFGEFAIDDAALARLGERLGADVPVCVYGRAAWVAGIGEHIEFAPDCRRPAFFSSIRGAR